MNWKCGSVTVVRFAPGAVDWVAPPVDPLPQHAFVARQHDDTSSLYVPHPQFLASLRRAPPFERASARSDSQPPRGGDTLIASGRALGVRVVASMSNLRISFPSRHRFGFVHRARSSKQAARIRRSTEATDERFDAPKRRGSTGCDRWGAKSAYLLMLGKAYSTHCTQRNPYF